MSAPSGRADILWVLVLGSLTSCEVTNKWKKCVGWNERKLQLTGTNKEEEFSLSTQLFVFRETVFHKKLTVVAVCVTDPQLRDGHIQRVAARVSADAGAVLVVIITHTELLFGVHEQHFTGIQPAALQVDTEGRRVSLLNRAGKNNGLPLMPLQELNVTAYLIKTKEDKC